MGFKKESTNILLLLAVLCAIMSLCYGGYGRRRRTRCYYRLCWKCNLYLEGRGKRSIPDDSTLLDIPTQDVSRRATWTPRDMHEMRGVLIDNLVFDPKARKKYSNQQIEERLMDEEEKSSDDDVVIANREEAFDVSPSSSDQFMDYVINGPTKLHYRRSARKRSVTSHISRCLYILNTRCCIRYQGTSTYIGFKVKRT